MKIGDEIGGAKIIEITNDYVKFQYKDKKKFLIKRIGEDVIDRSTSKKSIKEYKTKNYFSEYPEEYGMAIEYYNESMRCESFDKKIRLLDHAIRYAQFALPKTIGEQRERMRSLINDAREEEWNIGV